MGIQGLLPYLEKATRPCDVSEFRGGTLAIDSYCFLHKGATACVEQLARGEDSPLYVKYCLKYVKLLLSYNIHPIMVFDGRNLPAKAETEARRRDSRKKAKQRAKELIHLGKTGEARNFLKQSIDITPKMAYNLIVECRKLNVDCIVAPYESDAQLAFFNLKGIADAVITEDSDLVLFGCKKVLYKLDLNGHGRLVETEKIYLAMKMRPDQFTFEKFRYMCILSGCDYVDSLHGIGLKKAETFLKLTAETDPEKFIDKLPRYLNMKHLVITDEYRKKVMTANATFLHQIVFDPHRKTLTHLSSPESVGTKEEYLKNSGEFFDNEKAYQIALGNLNPNNFEQFDNWIPSPNHPYSIWSGVCKKRISVKEEKEISKWTFTKYLSATNESARKTSALEFEKQKINEDSQIEKELSIYTRALKVEKEVYCKHEPDVACDTETSPIISQNPFLKKKKLSKFPNTFADDNIVVKSRFFEPKKDEDLKEILHEECSEIIVKKRRVEDILTEVRTNESMIEIIDVDAVHYEKSSQKQEDTVTSNITKKKKLSSCRSVGLQKNRIGQQTLHNFFGTFNK
ncbi:exonuclease 1 [Cylas formicarius]|uniref:exonuclease 1 n=1 Tax=Cylas formicarius TaxID=197179 RepID=UPI0029589A5F|nr:exonuclease 1 [Cylas formicarius]